MCFLSHDKITFAIVKMTILYICDIVEQVWLPVGKKKEQNIFFIHMQQDKVLFTTT